MDGPNYNNKSNSTYQMRAQDPSSVHRSNTAILANSSRHIGASFDDLNGGGVGSSGNQVAIESNTRRRVIQTVVDLVVIVIIFVIFILVYFLFEPRIRYMTCDQSDIFFPYAEDTVPFWAVGLYATIGPIVFIVLIELLNARLMPLQKNKLELTSKERVRKFFVCTFHALSLFILGIALTLCLTEIGKRWVSAFEI